MSVQFSELAKKVAADGAVSGEELLAMRRAAWPDGQISQSEAEAIFALNRQLPDTDPGSGWVEFFVEALGEYILKQRPPVGYIDEESADWLIRQIDADGKLGSFCELELLVHVFERALNAPVALKDYALRQIERTVLEGSGPTRDGGELEAGKINATEATLLRRLLFAPGSERPAGIGPNEAELLFRLKNATLGAENAPEWKRLFVQGVASFLEGFTTAAAQVNRERAVELEAFFNDTQSSSWGFVRRFAKARPDWEGYKALLAGRDQAFADREANAAAGAEVTDSEREWLNQHIDADGELDEYEQALLDFLADA